ncbi:MAG: hypothetical protein ACLP8S_21480 [Solirubrobacteraceae bacterium]
MGQHEIGACATAGGIQALRKLGQERVELGARRGLIVGLVVRL